MAHYKLPAMFALDWLNRMDGEDFLPDAEALVVKPQAPKGTTVVLDLNDEQRRDLLADAQYYADTSDDYWDETVRPLCRSAKRVVDALRKQGVA